MCRSGFSLPATQPIERHNPMLAYLTLAALVATAATAATAVAAGGLTLAGSIAASRAHVAPYGKRAAAKGRAHSLDGMAADATCWCALAGIAGCLLWVASAIAASHGW